MPRAVLVLAFVLAGCGPWLKPGPDGKPPAWLEATPGDTVTAAPTAPSSPGLSGPSRPGGPGGGGGPMPERRD